MRFESEWDDEGVYFYQAFNDDIANWVCVLHFILYFGSVITGTIMTGVGISAIWRTQIQA